MGGDPRTWAAARTDGPDRQQQQEPNSCGSRTLHSCVGAFKPRGAGCGGPQTRLAGHTEPSAIVMRHLSSRPLRPGDITVTSAYKWIL